MQLKENQSKTQIQSFYSDQHILITGGTGYLGKLLIEKLLRCCHELTCIYVIVRKKKDETIHERIQHLLEQPIYNYVKQKCPQFSKKIIPIEGDCTLPNLGISKEDKDILLKKVSIVFHAAATVRFNEKLKKAVADNVFAIKELIDLCQSMTNLKALMHVSTFYAPYTRREIEEKFYDSPITGDRILKMTEVLSQEELDKLEKFLRKGYPNNYCFTKAIGEQIIQQNAKQLPIGVFRPAIVTSTYEEPFPGWIDNLSGPNIIITNAMTGLLKGMLCDTTKKAEIVPSDLTINALIVCAWDVGSNKTKQDEPFVYNYISTWTQSITWGEFFYATFDYEIPTINSLWCNNLMFFKNYWTYYISKIVLQTLPALIIDTALLIIGRKTWAMRTDKKLDSMVKIISFVPLYEWIGKNDRIKSLWKKISSDDQQLFPFSMENFNWHDYMKKFMIGIRIYVLKDPLETIPAAEIRRFRFIFLQKILKYMLLMLTILVFYNTFKS